jgi:phage tail-like protein
VRLEGFSATADIVGRRVQAAWTVHLDPTETLADVPRVRLRRKLRDFEFPAMTASDPFGVYDSSAFPPGDGIVTEFELGRVSEQDRRTITHVESVARPVDGVPVEVLRRVRSTTFDLAGRATSRTDSILDVDASPLGLTPGTTYYYELVCPDLPAGDPAERRAVATPTELHRTGRELYESLPAIYRRHDVVKGSERDRGAIPEANRDAGQLRRFIDLFGSSADHLRSRADGLRALHDVDGVDYRILPRLAAMLGWDLSHGKPIPIQRHEIKYAAHLYGMTGTVPGCLIWIKRLTGWDVRLKEFWRNVFFTNDLGNPADPSDHGSRTVDTSKPALVASIGRFEDTVDYVYDTGTGPDDWYAYNMIGIFATPRADETVTDVLRKRGRLLSNASIFLPYNLRLTVIFETETRRETAVETLGVTRTSDADL